MKPQTLIYQEGNGDQVTRLDGTNTFLVHCSKLQWGNLYVPTILVSGIEDETIKFDFHKVYKNKDEVVMHVEYWSTHDLDYKLIVHTE